MDRQGAVVVFNIDVAVVQRITAATRKSSRHGHIGASHQSRLEVAAGLETVVRDQYPGDELLATAAAQDHVAGADGSKLVKRILAKHPISMSISFQIANRSGLAT